MYNKILVPLDGSELAECTLNHVKAIASGCGVAEVILLNVTEFTRTAGMYWPTSREQAENVIAEENKNRAMIRQKANDYLKTASQKLTGAGLKVKTEVIEEAPNQHPADVILDYADKNKIDLIAIATHGRSGITRWAFGSEAEKIVRHSTVPVLSVTPAGCRPA